MKRVFIIMFLILTSLTGVLAWENGYVCQTDFLNLSNKPKSNTDNLYLKEQTFGYYPYRSKYTYDYKKIPYDKIDVLLYAFVWPKADGSLYIPEEYPELNFTAHRKGKKVLLSVGGRNNSSNFADIMQDDTKKAKFMKSLKDYITKGEFDGVDIDWEFPKSKEEAGLYISLLKELKQKFPGKIISTALNISPDYYYIDLCALDKVVDYIFLMGYDIEGWGDFAGYNAPLYRNSNLKNHSSIYDSLYNKFLPYISNPKKIILGFPLYGRKYETDNFYKYFSMGYSINYKDISFDGCIESFDDQSLVPKLFCNNQWGVSIISYDDIMSFYYKRQMSKSFGLGGMFYWSLGSDDNILVDNLSLTGDITKEIINQTGYQSLIDVYTGQLDFFQRGFVDKLFSGMKEQYTGTYIRALDALETKMIKDIYQDKKYPVESENYLLYKYILFRIVQEKAKN